MFDLFSIINQTDIKHQKTNYQTDLTLYIINFSWWKNRQNLIFTGKPQSGKTTFLCYIFDYFSNCETNVSLYSTPYLLQHIIYPFSKYCKKLINHSKKVDLLILDDFCTFRMNKKESEIFYEILKERNKPIVLASQHPVEKWKSIINCYADEITDLLLKNSIVINLKPLYELF